MDYKVGSCSAYWVKIYAAGPIDVARQIVRAECADKGLCVTVTPTVYIYTGGEEAGYVVGLVNYPRFPSAEDEIKGRAKGLAIRLLEGTFQRSIMLMGHREATWISRTDMPS